ncbi:MAG: hypothetical protein K2H16_08120 [Prevotella sp.]|nr:hypothetical protein [Prevotella sp.]
MADKERNNMLKRLLRQFKWKRKSEEEAETPVKKDKVMGNRYITYNERLNEKLNLLGFRRKNKETFIKKYGDGVQSIVWGHSTYHDEPHIKYYSVSVFIDFPVVKRIEKESGVLTSGFGRELGYLAPDPYYKEWRLADVATEEEVADVIDEVVGLIEYAMPVVDRCSIIRNVIRDMEDNKLKFGMNAKVLSPVLYLADGQPEMACKYVDNILSNLERRFQIEVCETQRLRELYGTDNIDVNSGLQRELENYRIYAEKLKNYVLTQMDH